MIRSITPRSLLALSVLAGRATGQDCERPYQIYAEANVSSVATCPGAAIQFKVFLKSRDPVEGFGIAVAALDSYSIPANDVTGEAWQGFTAGPIGSSKGGAIPDGWAFRVESNGNAVVALGSIAPQGNGVASPLAGGIPHEVLVIDVPLLCRSTPSLINLFPLADYGYFVNGQIIYTHIVVNGKDIFPGDPCVPQPLPEPEKPLLWLKKSLEPVAVDTCKGNFMRGDCNNNGRVVGLVGDIVFLLRNLFVGGEAPQCKDACDADGDNEIGVTDAVYMIRWLFIGGPDNPPPPAPGPYVCGCDPDQDTVLDCAGGFCP